MPQNPDWAARLANYPTPPADAQAVPEPVFDIGLDDLLGGIAPKRVDRAIERFQQRHATALFSDARLEGITYTKPEIVELIGGTHVPGHTEGEEYQVHDMTRALAYAETLAAHGPVEPSQAVSDDLHLFISAHLGLASIAFRGDQRETYLGPRVSLGRGQFFRALDARLTHDVLNAGLDRISRLHHPLARAATWAAFAAYHQFYLDGNKRTGRYVMNAVAMSHGYDAIVVPAARKSDYEDVVVGALWSGNLTRHIRFLLDLSDDC